MIVLRILFVAAAAAVAAFLAVSYNDIVRYLKIRAM